jgi:hypothetical protein
MKLGFDEGQREFERSLRALLAAADVPSVARSWASGDYDPGRKLWRRLLELGIGELAEHPVESVITFEELGRAAVPGPYVESIAVLPVLAPDLPPDALASLAVPPHVPYACDAAAADATYLLDGGTLYSATVAAELTSVDATRRLARVGGVAVVASDVDTDLAFDRGALATAAQLVGAGYAMLHQATEYAQARRQFGKPIGSFQAIKHQLADVYVELELARPLLFGAALVLDGPDRARDVSAAKVACADAAYRAARTALQVHGAIGYTAEYHLSLWLTKVRALVSAWGTQRFHRDRVLTALRAGSAAGCP